jgi:hypothetical protein
MVMTLYVAVDLNLVIWLARYATYNAFIYYMITNRNMSRSDEWLGSQVILMPHIRQMRVQVQLCP